MLLTYEGYLEDGRFYPIEQPTGIQGRCRVIVTVLGEASPEQKETAQARAWREFFEAINASSEETPETFARVNFTQEVAL